jgi:hypothetical protein
MRERRNEGTTLLRPYFKTFLADCTFAGWEGEPFVTSTQVSNPLGCLGVFRSVHICGDCTFYAPWWGEGLPKKSNACFSSMPPPLTNTLHFYICPSVFPHFFLQKKYTKLFFVFPQKMPIFWFIAFAFSKMISWNTIGEASETLGTCLFKQPQKCWSDRRSGKNTIWPPSKPDGNVPKNAFEWEKLKSDWTTKLVVSP